MVPLILSLDSASATPLHRQLYQEIRAAVLEGRLAAGARLPSTRALAADLQNFPQHRRRGLRTIACRRLYRRPARRRHLRRHRTARASTARLTRRPRRCLPAGTEAPQLSQRGRMLAGTPVAPAGRDAASPCAFRPGIPALDQFPRDLWARLAARIYRNAKFDLFSYGDAAGYPPLRRAIAEYLRAARGVHCDWRQVIVTSGSQQALDLAARILLDPGDTAWVEDPGYFGARGAWAAAGIHCAPVSSGRGRSFGGRGRATGPAGRAWRTSLLRINIPSASPCP